MYQSRTSNLAGTSRKVLDSSQKEVRDAIYFHGDKVSIERVGRSEAEEEEEEEKEAEDAIEDSSVRSTEYLNHFLPRGQREEGYSNAHGRSRYDFRSSFFGFV